MGRWGKPGRNYGHGRSSDRYSDRVRELGDIDHCKKCIHVDTNSDEPLKSFCRITNMLCITAIPICKRWQFKEVTLQQPIYVAKHQD